MPRQDHPTLGRAVTEAGVGSGEPVCGYSVSDDHGVNDSVREEPPKRWAARHTLVSRSSMKFLSMRIFVSQSLPQKVQTY